MKLQCLLYSAAFALLSIPAIGGAADTNRTVKQLTFAKGSLSAVVKGSVTGYSYIDYQLRAGAGQTMKASLAAGNRSGSFNLLPPESTDAAMFIGDLGDNRFSGVLPDDGVYTLRVFLNRTAARRNERSDYTLTVEVTGKPLPAIPAKSDALVAGTRYHAQGTVNCAPSYTQTRQCQAGVVRRGTDGTATVELSWDKTGKRRILFVKGAPVAADVPQAFKHTKNEKGYVIVFEGEERFEVPEPLVFGG